MIQHDDPLSQLALEHKTDKAADHWYTPHYDRRFSELRDAPIKLLEIGVGGYKDPHAGGNSLRMWRDYFTNPDADIIGIDVEKKDLQTPRGIAVIQADATNPGEMRKLGESWGPFDIIIDDGSHVPDDVMQAWVVLWDYLAMPGWYVIEDLQTSYWKPFGGSSERTGDTVIGFLQGLIDRIHYAEFDVPGYTPNRFDLSVVGLEIARNIVFIRKGDNSTPSEWMPAHPHGQVFKDDGSIDPEWEQHFPPVEARPDV
jgi:hypothetical protein